MSNHSTFFLSIGIAASDSQSCFQSSYNIQERTHMYRVSCSLWNTSLRLGDEEVPSGKLAELMSLRSLLWQVPIYLSDGTLPPDDLDKETDKAYNQILDMCDTLRENQYWSAGVTDQISVENPMMEFWNEYKRSHEPLNIGTKIYSNISTLSWARQILPWSAVVLIPNQAFGHCTTRLKYLIGLLL